MFLRWPLWREKGASNSQERALLFRAEYFTWCIQYKVVPVSFFLFSKKSCDALSRFVIDLSDCCIDRCTSETKYEAYLVLRIILLYSSVLYQITYSKKMLCVQGHSSVVYYIHPVIGTSKYLFFRKALFRDK